MRLPRPIVARAGAVVAAAIALAIPTASPFLDAASHREAPLIAMDPGADITDVFMFRSYETGKADRVVLIMDVTSEEPSSGPNYWTFDPDVLYAFNLDVNADGKADDVVLELRFRTEIRGVCKDLGLPLSYVALPAITKLDGSGSEGLCLRQKYDVTLVRGKVKANDDGDDNDDGQPGRRNRPEQSQAAQGRQKIGEDLIAVPSNVGPRTMPNYADLANQGIYQLGNGIRVFAGQRQDPFYIDLGGVFDTLNLRRNPPLLSAAEDANDGANPFGVDMLSGFNVQTIAVEIPANLLTVDRKGPGETAQPKLGLYANTSRRSVTVLRGNDNPEPQTNGRWVQVQRLANPLVNELIIGTPQKDRWNALDPAEESKFLDFYLNSRLALALETVFGVPANKTNRTDLRDLLLKYAPSDQQLSELLRLDLRVAPKPLGQQKRLTVLADPADNAGWPNGRRPKDDVTDIAIRVVGGPNYTNGRAGDGVNTDDTPLPTQFPFLATPANGRDRVHQNP